MAFVGSFGISQLVGDPSVVVLTDTSTGSDGNITQRRVYVQTSTGAYLVPDGTSTEYTEWNYSDTSISIDCLDVDYAVRIVVQWLDVADAVIDDSTQYAGLTGYNEDFDYTLTQNLSANPLLINDNNFWSNKMLLRVYIDSGDNAILRANDIFSAQQCYAKATSLRLGSQYNFNANS